jgi:thiol:disulfide interchange protein DsbG
LALTSRDEEERKGMTAPRYVARAAFAAITLIATACSQAESPATSQAQAPARKQPAPSQDQPKVLEALRAQGLDHIKEFPAGNGLRAFAGAVGDQPMAIYVTPDGNAIIGTRVDVTGKRIDDSTITDLVMKPLGDSFMETLSKAKWIRDGKADAPRIVYAFSDPNCPYCHAFWKAARPWVDAGKVQVRYLLVGVIREDSPNKAAAIMGAADPDAALVKNETTYEKGGVTALKTIPEAIQSQLDDNQMLMLKMGFEGTPGILMKGDDGKLVKLSGLPRDGSLEKYFGPL